MKAVAGIILTFLLGAMFVGLFNITAGMDMLGNMENCPYMSHEEVVCPMNLLGHIDAWKTTFLATTSLFLLLLAAAGTVAYVATVAPHLLTRRLYLEPPLPRQLRERTYSFSYRPLQELFSSGILHPKLFGLF